MSHVHTHEQCICMYIGLLVDLEQQSEIVYRQTGSVAVDRAWSSNHSTGVQPLSRRFFIKMLNSTQAEY